MSEVAWQYSSHLCNGMGQRHKKGMLLVRRISAAWIGHTEPFNFSNIYCKCILAQRQCKDKGRCFLLVNFHCLPLQPLCSDVCSAQCWDPHVIVWGCTSRKQPALSCCTSKIPTELMCLWSLAKIQLGNTYCDSCPSLKPIPKSRGKSSL